MQTVSQLLEHKPHNTVYTIGQGRSVLDAAELMNSHRVGALIVTDTLGNAVIWYWYDGSEGGT